MQVKRTLEIRIEESQLQVGDRILCGEAQWRVLDIQNNKALIWKCTNITDYVFNERGSNMKEGSDVQIFLRGAFRKSLPKEFLEKLIGDGFFLLTVEEAKKYMPKPKDRVAIDPAGSGTWWWTSTPCENVSSYAECVNAIGEFKPFYAHQELGIAPAAWIRLRQE